MSFWKALFRSKGSATVKNFEEKPAEPPDAIRPQPTRNQQELDAQSEPAHQRKHSVVTPEESASFYVAIEGGDLEKMQAMFKDNPDLVSIKQDGMGMTPLHFALEKGLSPAAELLIANGADVNEVSTTPWQFRHSRGMKAGSTPLHVALDRGLDRVAELLIAKGANVNVAIDANPRTFLNFALEEGFAEVAELLIAKGANVNITNYDRATPLHLALYGGFDHVAELLIARGADVNAVTRTFERTPLQLASGKGLVQVASMLIAKGASVNAADVSGDTALHNAAADGHLEMVKLLVANGATSLYVAVTQGRIDLLNALIEKGSDVNAKDSRYARPLRSCPAFS